MTTIRLRLTDPADVPPRELAAARAELDRLAADRRPTYLGLRPAVAIATGLTAVVVGATLGLTIPTGLDRVAPCGVVVEAGVAVPAACASDLDERLATIRAERSGGRWSR